MFGTTSEAICRNSFLYNENEKVKAFIITVTPSLASEWLQHNLPNNRNIKQNNVYSYANAMKRKEWGLCPDAIAFDREGNLINGQHRLNAVMRSGITTKMFVVFDFPATKQDFLFFDVGAKRNIRDNLRAAEIDDVVITKAIDIAGAYIRLKHNKGEGRPVSISERIAFIRTNYEIMQWAIDVCKHNKPTSGERGKSRMPSIYAVAMIDAYLCGEDEEALEKFADVYCKNDFSDTENYSVEYVIALRDSKKSNQSCNDTLNFAKSCIEAFCQKRARRKTTKLYQAPVLLMQNDMEADE